MTVWLAGGALYPAEKVRFAPPRLRGSNFQTLNLKPCTSNKQQASSNKQQATSETSNLQTLNLENQPLLKTTELQISGILGF
jgi:hypothetical protein